MAEQNYSIDEDLHETEEMVKALVPYLESNEVYGKVGGGGIFGGGNMPALTAGALEMRLRRLEMLYSEMTPGQQSRFTAVKQQLADILKDWRAHYEKKLLREANSRLDAMRTFFQEASESPTTAGGIYKPEVLRRTIVEEISIALDKMNVHSEELDKKIRMTDSRLKGVAVQQADFQWAPILEPVYPQKDYWWLYRKPREISYA